VRLNVRRQWRRWLVGSVLVLGALVVGGPFVYFHFIEGSAPARLHLPSSRSASPGAGPATGLNGTWKVTPGSQAGYRVDEILFGQSHTAVGRTAAVTGQLSINQATAISATVVVDLRTVSSDSGLRDRQFQGRIMDTATFPTATFTLTNPIRILPIPALGTAFATRATGNLTARGSPHSVVADLQARRDGDTIQVAGSIPVRFSTWNIPNPSFGPASTGDTGLIEFLLTYRQR
jgi:polyisoprenoid-binding protein YceI